jgi:uncharacterized membrane protein
MNHATLDPILATILGVPARTFWPCFSGTLVLLLGSGLLLWTDVPKYQGLDRMIVLGRVLFAAPMAVFGTEHFVLTDDIVRLVPSWMPGHLFWTYLTGTGLIAASLSIVVRKQSGLAAMLLGVMFLSFVLLIWLPQTVATAGNRFALAVLLRETAFSSGSFALAVTEGFGPLVRRSRRVIPLARLGIGVPVIVFGVEHFLHPSFVPVVPLRQPMPTWIPAGIALVYGMGATLIVCGAGIVLNRKARLSAVTLGTAINVVVLLVYVPLIVAQPSVAVGLNYLADTLAFGGTVLLLAGALV